LAWQLPAQGLSMGRPPSHRRCEGNQPRASEPRAPPWETPMANAGAP
jgi:hypothetical protein